MSQQITTTRINYPHGDVDPVRIMRCDAVIDTRLVGGNISISNIDPGSSIEISGDVTVDQIKNTVDVNVINAVEISGGVTATAKETNYDGFGRLRVSNPHTLFEFTSVYPIDLSNDLRFDISRTGNGSISNEDSVTLLHVQGNGDRVIIQSREYVLYQPGKSRLVYLTGVLKPSEGFEGTSLLGSFDGSFGYAFGYDTNGVFITERDNGTDTKVYQDDWNVDSLDDISFEKAQIYTMDQEWLGVGQVRLGCVVSGEYRLCHKFTHKNELDAPYFATAKLPVRYEIESDGSGGTLGMICGTIISEGGFNSLGNHFGTNQPGGGFSVGSTPEPIISLRLQNSYPDINTTIKIQQIDLINDSNTREGFWTLIFNPTTLSGTFTDAPYPNSSAQICYHTNNQSLSGGTVITSGFLPQRGPVELTFTPDDILRAQGIGRTIGGVSDIITLAVRAVTQTPTIYGSLNWLEIR